MQLAAAQMQSTYRRKPKRSTSKLIDRREYRKPPVVVASREPAAAGDDNLGNTSNSVERIYTPQELKALPKPCRCYQCEKCSRRHLAWRRRKWMMACLGHPQFVEGAWMLTVTIDRNGIDTGHRWESPEAVYDHVNDKRVIWNLLRYLGVTGRAWFMAVEWQMQTADERGNGWPHWHIALPCSVDVERAAAWLKRQKICGRPKIGVDLKAPGDLTKDAIANYLSGYLSKGGQCGDWVRPRERVRTVSASRSCDPPLPTYAEFMHSPALKVAEFKKEEADDDRRDEKRSSSVRRRRTVGERVDSCGEESTVIAERKWYDITDQGEVIGEGVDRWYVDRVLCDLRAIQKLADRTGHDVRRDVETKVVRWQPGEIIGIDVETWASHDEFGHFENLWTEEKEVCTYVPGTSVPIGLRGLYLSEQLLALLPRKNSEDEGLAAQDASSVAHPGRSEWRRMKWRELPARAGGQARDSRSL